MAARRMTLALPASDPASSRIWEFVSGLSVGADVSAELRRLIVEALDAGVRLASIEAKLDQLLARGPGVALAEPEPQPVELATIEALLDFGV